MMSKPAKTKKLCVGCHDNFYNGNNDLGVKECWSYPDAKVIRKKFVHIDQRPPWNQDAEWAFDCCQRERFISVRPRVTC